MKNGVRSVVGFFRRRWLLVLIVLLIAAGAGFWWYRSQTAQASFTTQTPEYRDLVDTIDFSGEINAKERVAMHFSSIGKLVYLGAQEGDTVTKGQTLASLDQRTLQKQLDKTLSLYETQRWQFENSEDDRKDEVLDTQEQRVAEMDQFALERSVLDVQMQNLAFDSYRLTAPFSGILVQSPYTVPGVFVAPTDTWQLVNPETLYFRVLVDEIDIDMVSVGQEALVEIDALPNTTFRAVVEKISYSVANSASGTVFPIELRFLDPVNIEQQRLGMSGEARLVLDKRDNVLSVPIEALITREGKNYVQVLTNGKAEDREVRVGVETDEYAEIISGLNEQDQVILP